MPKRHLHKDRALDPSKVLETAEALHRRIQERFPDSGLAHVATQVVERARDAIETCEWIGRPHILLRLSISAIVAGAIAFFYLIFSHLHFTSNQPAWYDFLQGLDAGTNEIIYLCVAVLFLVTLELRFKRNRALDAINDLRFLAHVIDMHQLTKDPERVNASLGDTKSSPARIKDREQLTRYLDYCSELLAILSKIAAIYITNFHDHVALDAVDQIEDLVSGLSRKIWQKIMILSAAHA